VKCPFCESNEVKVVDSRDTESRDAVRRRRECISCQRRFTTYERVEEQPLTVVKRGGEREVFSRGKLLEGLVRACEKRPVSMEKLEELVDDIERQIKYAVQPAGAGLAQGGRQVVFLAGVVHNVRGPQNSPFVTIAV